MCEYVSSVPGDLRYEDRVISLEALAARHHVLETDQIIEAGEIKAVADRGYAQTPLECPLGDAKLIWCRRSDQEQLTNLVGGDRECDIPRMQPSDKPR